MSSNATGAKNKSTSAGFLLGIGLVVGLSFGFSSGAASGVAFVPAWAWNLISFLLGGVAVLLFQWATARNENSNKVAGHH